MASYGRETTPPDGEGGRARAPADLLAALRRLEPRVPSDELLVLSRSDDGLVVRVDDFVLKVHEDRTDAADLARRLRAIRARSDVFLQPLSLDIERCADRLLTRWPLAEALRPDDVGLPWGEAATLLGRLHAQHADVIDPEHTLPSGGGPRRVLRAVDRLRDAEASAERTVVLEAFATLGDLVAHGRADRVVHGDFHLGQLVTCRDGLRFIDVDEVGRGDPAWDLARPAAWYAIGLMPEAVWHTFVDAYRVAAGSEALLPPDPWAALEAPARALVVQTAARGVLRREPGSPVDGFDAALLGACERIGRTARGEPA